MSPEIVTTGGAVRGMSAHGLTTFLGIPYAEPPSGALRFRPPRARRPWSGVIDALRYSPSPPQAPDVSVPAPPPGVPLDDYLSVNVWVPQGARPGAPLPVLVWVYGGGFIAGDAADASFEPSTLARDARALVVSMNYRVGVEGFGFVPGAPHNRGLLDVLLCMEWVQENINAFGGDPDNITVYGQSAGAGTVAALLSMPDTGRFWSRAVLGSLPCLYDTPALAADVGEKVARHVGVRNSAEALAAIPPDALVEAIGAVGRRQTTFTDWGRAAYGTPMAPVVDGEVLPAAPWQSFRSGALAGKPLLIGHTREEMTLFMNRWGTLGRITEEEAAACLAALAPGGGDDYRAAYPDADADRLYMLCYSDWMLRMPTTALAAAHQGPTYLYELTHTVPVKNGALGSPHCGDIPLVFGDYTEGLGIELYGGKPSEADRALGDLMRADWAAFVHEGDPGWQPYDTETQPTRVYEAADAVSVTAYPETASQRIWEGFAWDAMDLR
jgi:para-nitrobenzyl esterase